MQNLLKSVAVYKAMVRDRRATSINVDAVARQVLTSQPPRPSDVPDIVAYVLKWGGLPEGGFVKTLCEEFKALVPSDRIVSGVVFRKLADLKFPPTEFPAQFVNAALFAHAHASEQVQDS